MVSKVLETQARQAPRSILVKPGNTGQFWINLFDGIATQEKREKTEIVQREIL